MGQAPRSRILLKHPPLADHLQTVNYRNDRPVPGNRLSESSAYGASEVHVSRRAALCLRRVPSPRGRGCPCKLELDPAPSRTGSGIEALTSPYGVIDDRERRPSTKRRTSADSGLFTCILLPPRCLSITLPQLSLDTCLIFLADRVCMRYQPIDTLHAVASQLAVAHLPWPGLPRHLSRFKQVPWLCAQPTARTEPTKNRPYTPTRCMLMPSGTSISVSTHPDRFIRPRPLTTHMHTHTTMYVDTPDTQLPCTCCGRDVFPLHNLC